MPSSRDTIQLTSTLHKVFDNSNKIARLEFHGLPIYLRTFKNLLLSICPMPRCQVTFYSKLQVLYVQKFFTIPTRIASLNFMANPFYKPNQEPINLRTSKDLLLSICPMLRCQVLMTFTPYNLQVDEN